VPLTSEFSQLTSRIVAILFIIWCGTDIDVSNIAVALVLGGTIGLLGQVYLVFTETKLRYRFTVNLEDSHIRDILQQAPSLVLAAVAPPLAFFVMQRLATFAGGGSPALLSYSLFLVSPLSILIGKPIYLIWGKQLSHLTVTKNYRDAQKLLWRLVHVSLCFTLPLCLLLFVYSPRLISFFYGGGVFDSVAISETSKLTRIAIFAIPSAVIYWITLVPMVNNRKGPWNGLNLAVGSGIQVTLSLILFPYLRLTGLIIAYVFGMSFQAVLATLRCNHLLRRQYSSTVLGNCGLTKDKNSTRVAA